MSEPIAITWRELTPTDVVELRELDAACKQAYGMETISNLVGDALSTTARDSSLTHCACAKGRLIAVAWVRPGPAHGEPHVQLDGRVHPEYSSWGLGGLLLDWAERRAHRAASLIFPPGAPLRLVIRCEALTPEIDALYTQNGFTAEMVEEMLAFDLRQPLEELPLPPEVHTVPWESNTAGRFFHAYRESFRDRPGFPNLSEAEWVEGYDAEAFLPGVSMLALEGELPVGFVTCERSDRDGWISQVGVVPSWRQRGLGSALVVGALRQFQALSLNQALLHVNVNNPPAISVYERLGFQRRLRRARYSKIA
jgi:ribosomal protein S18 acetylase RimI-like enzyme